jgi:hypothetical protein
MAPEQPPQLAITVDERSKRFLRCAQCPSDGWHSVVVHARLLLEDDTGRQFREYEIIRCDGCMTVSFREAWELGDPGAAPLLSGQRLFPERSDRKFRRRMRGTGALPAKVGQIYDETIAAVNEELPILAGIGVRALVEAVCKHKRIKGGNLRDKIDGLAKVGLLGGTEAKILHRLRFLGNKAAHETKVPTSAELSAGLDIAEHLLTTVYLLAGKAMKLPSRGR